jgi:hypothetical protein
VRGGWGWGVGVFGGGGGVILNRTVMWTTQAFLIALPPKLPTMHSLLHRVSLPPRVGRAVARPGLTAEGLTTLEMLAEAQETTSSSNLGARAGPPQGETGKDIFDIDLNDIM